MIIIITKNKKLIAEYKKILAISKRLRCLEHRHSNMSKEKNLVQIIDSLKFSISLMEGKQVVHHLKKCVYLDPEKLEYLFYYQSYYFQDDCSSRLTRGQLRSIRQALSILKLVDRRIYVKRTKYGLTYRQLANIFNETEGFIEYHFYKAKKVLKVAVDTGKVKYYRY
ncbi:hypothetical protein [Paucilactobacillus kaifaensis]|uniref:hypothetical protein n=1 Tax=Paucilactobacillus kaifaensis TaxID=2559921 RepID=UPI0010F6515F|nr:hypothetical protein [Paucilactobacillus kaifaensis]